MVSKKLIAPTLAGTGAAGAAGTMAWALGLFDGEGLESKERAGNPSGSPNPSPSREKVERKRIITHVSNEFFTAGGQASSVDKQVINSGLTLKVEWKSGTMQSIYVDAEKNDQEDFSWKCRLNPIAIDGGINSGSDSSEFKRQTEELKNALKDENKKRQFVANCSYTRLDSEKTGGNDSTIELETEQLGYNKYKFKETGGYFERIWTEDFKGIYRLSTDEEENIVKKETNWNIRGEKGESETEGKVTVSLNSKKLTCNISGDYGGKLESRTFKDKELKDILGLGRYNSGELEKKRYLIRNCLKNKNDIKGLTIRASGGKEWEFSDLKKIYEGMYENPTAT